MSTTTRRLTAGAGAFALAAAGAVALAPAAQAAEATYSCTIDAGIAVLEDQQVPVTTVATLPAEGSAPGVYDVEVSGSVSIPSDLSGLLYALDARTLDAEAGVGMGITVDGGDDGWFGEYPVTADPATGVEIAATGALVVPFSGSTSVDFDIPGDVTAVTAYFESQVQTFDADGEPGLAISLECDAPESLVIGTTTIVEPEPEPPGDDDDNGDDNGDNGDDNGDDGTTPPNGPKRPVVVETDGLSGVPTSTFFGLALASIGAAALLRRPARD